MPLRPRRSQSAAQTIYKIHPDGEAAYVSRCKCRSGKGRFPTPCSSGRNWQCANQVVMEAAPLSVD